MKQISAPQTIQIIWSDGNREEVQEELLLEYELRVVVNGCPAFRCACTPTDLESLVVGRLFAEGRINSVEDIAQLQLQAQTDCAEVTLQKSSEPVVTQQTNLFCWKPEWIFQLAEIFAADTVVHRSTACTQSCLLAQENRVLYAAEDISRHNAVDKAIGWGLRQGIALENCMLYTSGRVPVDMMQKVIRAGVPMMISNTAPTKDAVLLAEQHGVTVLGGVKNGRMKVYTKKFI